MHTLDIAIVVVYLAVMIAVGWVVGIKDDPAVAAENTGFTQFLCPNKDSYPLLEDSLRANAGIFLPADIKAKCEVLTDLGEKNALYVKVWDEIKNQM